MLSKGAPVCALTTLRGECGFCGKALRTRVFQTRDARVQGQPLQVLSASAWPRRRMFSTTSAPRSSSDSPIKVSYLLGALLVFGIGTTSWGLYEFYTALTTWPKEFRGDLRAGLRAKQRGDMKLARRHLTKAWEAIQSMDPVMLSPDPYLKYSGVAVVLAEVLEADRDFEEAFDVLKKALLAFVSAPNPRSDISPASQSNTQASDSPSSNSGPISTQSSPWAAPSPPRLSVRALLDFGRASTIKSQLNSKARMRAVALALKLGDLAESLKMPEEEERWLGFAVAEVLRLVRDEYGLVFDPHRGFSQNSQGTVTSDNKADFPKEGPNHETSVRDILNPDSNDELGLPSWVSLTKSELAAPMERLGAFYGRQRKYGNAITLYRVASALLVRSRSTNENAGASRPSIAELCQALQIENAHMALMMEFRRVRPEDPTIQHDIPLIFGRAVSIYDEAVKQNGRTKLQDEGVGTESEIMLCDETYPALFYNAGVYYEELGDLDQAFRSYSLSYRALRAKGGSQEMMFEALEHARRVQRAINKNAKQVPQDAARSGTTAIDS